MARPKAKIPQLTGGPPSNFKLDPGQWKQIELAIGKPLHAQIRNEILIATKKFLRLAEAESNTGLIADAISRAEGFRDAASTLIEMKEDARVPISTRGYVDDLIALYGSGIDLATFYEELKRYARGCEAALDDMNTASQETYWIDGWAWQLWIRELLEIAERYGLKTGVRKDSDKVKNEKVSAFVRFVGALQNYIPDEHRRHIQSPNALAGGISKARKKEKSILD